MKIYNLKKVENCFVCGNIDKNMDRFIHMVTSNLSKFKEEEHPKELERRERLKKRIPSAFEEMANLAPRPQQRNLFSGKKSMLSSKNSWYDNSLIIVSGNGGIGSKSQKYYDETFAKLDKILSDNNCYIFFVRGNNDNPSIFNESKIDFEHIKTIPDYSVILLKKYNCLCIGGSISIDKEWKLSQEKSFGKKLYWENEAPYFDEKCLDEILAKYKIDCIVTSTSPSFVFPGTNAFKKSKWIKDDSKIKNEISNERKVLDKIYGKITEKDTKPYVWFYGRFKQANYTKVNDILFQSLVAYQIENVSNVICSFFDVNLEDKLGKNDFAFDAFIAEKVTSLPEFSHDEEELDEVFEDEPEGGGFAFINQDVLETLRNDLGAENQRPIAEEHPFQINNNVRITLNNDHLF